MEEIKVTAKEQKAIKSLKRLAKTWPDSISLFSWSGSLVVMKEYDGRLAVIDNISGIFSDGGDPQIGSGGEVYDSNEVDVLYE